MVPSSTLQYQVDIVHVYGSCVAFQPKNLFTLRLKRAYRCRLCDTVPTTDHNTQLANIYPKTRSSVSVLQDKPFFIQLVNSDVLECSPLNFSWDLNMRPVGGKIWYVLF